LEAVLNDGNVMLSKSIAVAGWEEEEGGGYTIQGKAIE